MSPQRKQLLWRTFYYLGRLTGSPAQIEAVLLAQAGAITKDIAGAAMTACAQTVAHRSGEVQAIGERLAKSKTK